MVDPHKELAKAPRRKRFAAWFRALSTTKKTITITTGVVAVLALIAVIVIATLTVQSLTSDDLAIYLAATPATLATELGAENTLAVTASAKNLPFCTARCTYTVTDHLTGTIIDEGDTTLRTGIDKTIDVTYQAPASYERDGLVTITFSCANTPTTFCRSTGEERYAATAIKVLTRYGQEQEQARAAFTQAYDERRDDLARERGLLETLATKNDPRIATITAAAQTEAVLFDERTTSIADALAAEDYARANELLAAQMQAQTIADYEDQREREGTLRTMTEHIEQVINTLSRIAVLTTADTQDNLASISDAFTYALARANETTILVTEERITAINNSLATSTEQIINDAVAGIAERAANAQDDARTSCLLYERCDENTTNAAVNETNATQELDALLRAQTINEQLIAYCAFTNNPDERLDAHRLAYAREAIGDENATIDEALAALDVETVTNRTDYNEWRAATLAAITNASNTTYAEETASSLTPAERLALNPEPRTTASDEACVGVTTTPFPSLPEPLPELSWTLVDTPTLTPPPRQCCDNGLCAACPATQKTPIVFVHGFSFSQGTTPETNLNAFGPLATQLDEANIARYLGHVFPQQFADATAAVSVANLPGRSSMTATYYYDSYGQDGELSLVTRKTENLETYALRLREAVAVARARTGQDRVVIVAHSMGGLVTRRYLQLFGEDAVEAVVMIGTPNAGITGRTRQFCGVLGSELECRDMDADSVFLQKLNAETPPTIPVYTIIGTGCDTSGEDGDGVITADSVRLAWATNIPVNGTCTGRAVLHSTLLDPRVHPDVAHIVRGIVERYD